MLFGHALQGRYSETIIDNPQSQGLIASLVTKIINNLQVTVRNIHIRYEDKLSVPGVCERDHAIVCNLM